MPQSRSFVPSRTVFPSPSVPDPSSEAPNASFPPPAIIAIGLLEALEGGGGSDFAPPANAVISNALAAHVQWGTCGAMEGLLAPRALLAPVALWDHFGSDRYTYAGTLAVCAISLGIAAVLGAVCTIIAYFVPSSTIPSRADGASASNAPPVACAAVRFPATMIETFLFLANGAAVAAGMALGGGGGPLSKANGGADGSMAAAAVAAALLVAAPFAACVAVGQWAPRKALRRTREAVQKGDSVNSGAVAIPPRDDKTDAARQRYRQGPKLRRPRVRRMHRSFGCFTVVVPSPPASPPPLTRSGDLFGPVAGDLPFLNRLAPAAPFALPLALLAVSVAVAAAERCDALPLAAGAVLAAYAVLVAALRPFVGAARVGAAAGLAAVAAALLFGLYGALAAAPSPAAWGADGAVSALLAAPVAVSNCWYPFAVARAPGLRLPSFTLRCGVPYDQGKESSAAAAISSAGVAVEDAAVIASAADVEADSSHARAVSVPDGNRGCAPAEAETATDAVSVICPAMAVETTAAAASDTIGYSVPSMQLPTESPGEPPGAFVGPGLCDEAGT